MTVHDELVLRLIDADKWGKATGYITKIVGSSDINYHLEELYHWRGMYEQLTNEFVKMCPDIVVTNLKSNKTTAIELEGDEGWDFAKSLRQIKKYNMNSDEFNNVAVVVPKKYERFAILYAREGFRVYFWEATRIWQCLGCGQKLDGKDGVKPKHQCKFKTELQFEGIKDVKFTEFEYAMDKLVR
jgi:hypothetical protein